MPLVIAYWQMFGAWQKIFADMTASYLAALESDRPVAMILHISDGVRRVA